MPIKTCYLIKIPNATSLNDVVNLNTRHTEQAGFGKLVIENVPEGYRTVNFSMEIDNIDDQNLNIDINEQEKIEFLPVSFTLEHKNKNVWKDSKKTQIKPKSEVIGQTNPVGGFFVRDEQLYMALYTSNYSEVSKVQRLLHLINSNVDTINSELFTWLFYVYDVNNGIIDENISVTDMKGFTSNIISNDSQDQIRGISGAASSMSATQLEIALNHSMESVDVGIKSRGIGSNFLMDLNYRLVINTSWDNTTSIFNRSYEHYKTQHSDLAIAIYIYAHIIPMIKTLYEEQQEAADIEGYRVELAEQLIARLQEVIE